MKLTKKKICEKKSIFWWMVKHVRPYIGWDGKGYLNNDDDCKDIIKKTKDNVKIGIKLKFKW